MGFFDIFKATQYKEENVKLKQQLQEIGYPDFEAAKSKLSDIEQKISRGEYYYQHLQTKAVAERDALEKAEKQKSLAQRKADKIKELYRAMEYSLGAWKDVESHVGVRVVADRAGLEELIPTVTLNLHCRDMRDLRKAFKENEKAIDKVVEAYRGRYTTKANQTIYELMVIALRAELQNILYALKYEKLDAGIDNVKLVTAKYMELASAGNQSIATTIRKFVGEIEYLFINAVKIEYNYYVKKEQARQEQIAIREQMKQEAEERKALERERKRIEAEEQKYKDQIEALKAKMETATEEEKAVISAEIGKVEAGMADVILKKDEIAKLEHGKAGYIYIISNLGSFGEDVFKIGMTRRSDPQGRVDELGDASVPFRFDVHSFIFSEDAVSLETALHHRLNDRRVNKVNLRKEFFHATIDELEELTNELSPAAEFTRTMLAEEYRQSISADGNYISEPLKNDEEDEDEE